MSKILTDNKYYSQIADVIREQNGTNNTYTPPQMVSALKDLFYEEVEGVPPISFNGIGENLLDYKIDGASGGVGDLITDISDDNYGKYKVPVVVNGKNLLKINATSQTINGVTFTVNNDGSVTCNGTASATAVLTITNNWQTNIILGNKYIGSGCPSGGSDDTYYLDLHNFGHDTGNSVIIRASHTEGQSYKAQIVIRTGCTCDNLTFYPMIRKADIEDDTYEPYIEPTTTNIYLDKPIEAKANIPSEYEEVEYIESTGTQYIDTGFVPNSNSGFKTKIMFSGYTAGIDDFLIGLRSNSNYGRFAYTCTDFNNITFYCSFGTTTSSSYRYNSNMPTTEIIECELNYKNSNTTITQGVEGLLPDKNNFIGEGLSFYLAGAYNARGIPKYKAMRQYKCELTQGTEVVRDLVPCYRNSDNVAGLYDLVNNVFYTNQGTGNFIVGPIKENESISLSDTNVDILTIEGTNVLTIDTTIQPSNVYIQAPKDSLEAIQIANRLEEI